MVSERGLLVAAAAEASPSHLTSRKPLVGVAVNVTCWPALYQASVILTDPGPAVKTESSYCEAAQFQVRVELRELVNTTLVPLPLGGTLPVPVQPVQT